MGYESTGYDLSDGFLVLCSQLPDCRFEGGVHTDVEAPLVGRMSIDCSLVRFVAH
jgi:hypothetical protein